MTNTAKRLTLANLRQGARKHAATVDEQSSIHGSVNVDAPAGFVWAASGTHALCVDAGSIRAHAGPIVWHQAVEDALDRMAHGLVRCDDEECEWCKPGEGP